jgi:hypothetical protein
MTRARPIQSRTLQAGCPTRAASGITYTNVSHRPGTADAGSTGHALPPQTNKSFLVLFFKKEQLPFLFLLDPELRLVTRFG